MVHWLGDGTNVMLSLARNSPSEQSKNERPDIISPRVYISYDNGNTFEDKTYLFQINNTHNSSLDQFTTHPTYNTVSSRRN